MLTSRYLSPPAAMGRIPPLRAIGAGDANPVNSVTV
jgi:hypothetical protein